MVYPMKKQRTVPGDSRSSVAREEVTTAGSVQGTRLQHSRAAATATAAGARRVLGGARTGADFALHSSLPYMVTPSMGRGSQRLRIATCVCDGRDREPGTLSSSKHHPLQCRRYHRRLQPKREGKGSHPRQPTHQSHLVHLRYAQHPTHGPPAGQTPRLSVDHEMNHNSFPIAS